MVITPSRAEHAKHCRKLYGYGFEEIHAWMDGTVTSKGVEHRVDRHDPYRTPDKAYDIFKDKVPVKYRKYIKDAVKDHIELDKREGKIRKEKAMENLAKFVLENDGVDLGDLIRVGKFAEEKGISSVKELVEEGFAEVKQTTNDNGEIITTVKVNFERKCSECGAKLQSNANFCTESGAKI